MAKFTRRKILASAGAAAAAAALGGLITFNITRRRRKNVVWIVSDALRADRLGCYGYRSRTASGMVNLTPNIDRLAEKGVVFERCYAPSSWTMQSVAAMMTSRPPFVEGDYYNEGFAAREFSTVAEVLSAGGYQTAALVKNPWLWTLNALRRRDRVVARGFAVYHTGYMKNVPNPLYSQGIGGKEEALNYSGAASAVKQVSVLLPEMGAGRKPFFLYVHLMDTHEPYNPPDEYKAACPVAEVKDVPDFMLHKAMREYARRRGEEKLAPSDMPLFERARGLYDTAVKYVDDSVGELVKVLDRLGVRDDTIMVFSSDHGEEFAEHGWIGHKTTLFEESLRVPLVVSGAGVPGGRRSLDMVSSLDVAPTILAACGIEAPGSMFGRALDLSGGGDAMPRAAVASLVLPVGVSRLTDKLYALVDPRGMKLIRLEHLSADSGTAPVSALYDLKSDPGEKADAAASKPDATGALEKQLAAIRAANKGTVEKPVEIDKKTRRQLKSLGYLNG
jgi:arylsulfatase A-like enzyme